MKHTFIILFILLLLTPLAIVTGDTPTVHIIRIDDKIINPIIQEYITTAIKRAETENAECLIIELDTPGGLLTSTRNIVKEIMNARVPIVTYVSPNGARAGSAGVFITLASHITAMAPSTNIGAAHPVNLDGGGKSIPEMIYELIKSFKGQKCPPRENQEEQPLPAAEEAPETTKDKNAQILSEKILNDTVAWVKAIAQVRGRNIEWAEAAVRKSVSETEIEALELNIVDFVAHDIRELLTQINGKTVLLDNKEERVITVDNARHIYRDLSTRQKILLAISHPNIAYILMMLGFYGLLFEITHPGIGFPGIAGAICLILAFFALSTLPINYAGLLLIVLALILFIAEVTVTSYGLLTLGGLVCMFLGSLMLIESPYSLMKVSLQVIFPVVISTALITIFLVSAVIKAHRQKSLVGKEGLIGEVGVAETDIAPFGTVHIHGEIWQARSTVTIHKGEEVKVINIKHLELLVEKHN